MGRMVGSRKVRRAFGEERTKANRERNVRAGSYGHIASCKGVCEHARVCACSEPSAAANVLPPRVAIHKSIPLRGINLSLAFTPG